MPVRAGNRRGHVAYQTSGNIAVFDEGGGAARGFCAEMQGFWRGQQQAERIEQQVEGFHSREETGAGRLRRGCKQLKGLISRTERGRQPRIPV